MPDQERDDPAFAAWWARFAETYPLATVEPKIEAAACLAWHAALASVQPERDAAVQVASLLMGVPHGGRPDWIRLTKALIAYDAARAGAEKEES